VDREASDKERQKDIPTFKDNDFLNDRIKISIGEEAKVGHTEKIIRNLAFLNFLSTHC
jgi:1-phosphatidylinositol-5-phosphate 4-kinase